jgi:GNAT superfamily N-acetyltransferase
MAIPRREHNARPINERLQDEDTSEVYTKDKNEWADNMDAYDYKCVDDPVPSNIKISIQNTGSKILENAMLFSIEDTDSYIELFKMLNDRYHISIVHTDADSRNKCHAAYLMREVVNFADQKCFELSLTAQPYDMSANVDFGRLINFYSDFGFKKEGFAIEGISQDMLRDKRCVI